MRGKGFVVQIALVLSFDIENCRIRSGRTFCSPCQENIIWRIDAWQDPRADLQDPVLWQ